MAPTQVACQASLNRSTTGQVSRCVQKRWQRSEKPSCQLFREGSHDRPRAAQRAVASGQTSTHRVRRPMCERHLLADFSSNSRFPNLHPRPRHPFHTHTSAKDPDTLAHTSLICQAKGKHDKVEKPKSKKEKRVPPVEQDQPPLRLILLRHAKSSWDDPTLADHERPLNKRGRKAAPDVAAQIRSRGWLPAMIFSSDSVRTRETLRRMGEEWQELAGVPTEFLHSFYDVAAADEGPTDTAQHLEDVVVEKAGDARSVMLVGHNMGWEQAASHFAGEYVAMKTSFAVLLESPRATWKEAFREKWYVAAVIKPESSKAAA